jgi:hypothetical protein
VSRRLYLPTTTRGLRRLAADGVLPPEEVSSAGPVAAEGDDEESEYAALMTAADLSTDLGADLGVPGGRRVVVVLEQGAPEGVPVRAGDVVAVHLDPEDRAADADPDEDLAWFAPEELPHLA